MLIKNAGINRRLGAMHDVDEAQFQRLLKVNLQSIYLSARHVVPLMREQGQGGAITNNTPTAAIRPRAGQAWYSGLKSPAVGLTRAMAIELDFDQIRVITPTPLVMKNLAPERVAQAVQAILLGRLGRPAGTANAALFLASDGAGFVMGTVVEVDGGREGAAGRAWGERRACADAGWVAVFGSAQYEVASQDWATDIAQPECCSIPDIESSSLSVGNMVSISMVAVPGTGYKRPLASGKTVTQRLSSASGEAVRWSEELGRCERQFVGALLTVGLK